MATGTSDLAPAQLLRDLALRLNGLAAGVESGQIAGPAALGDAYDTITFYESEIEARSEAAPGVIKSNDLLTFDTLQQRQKVWRERQPWAGSEGTYTVPGLYELVLCIEYLGRAAHAHLKREQGIRGEPAMLDARCRQACEDLLKMIERYMLQRGWRTGHPNGEPGTYKIPGLKVFLGIAEELGELVCGHRNEEELACGAKAEDCLVDGKPPIERTRDSLGDIDVYLADYHTVRGFRRAEVVSETWAEVEKRDWAKNRVTGA